MAHKNVHRFKWIIKKKRSLEVANAELYLKGAAKELVVYGLQPLAARLHELGSKLERLDCFHWFYSE